MATKGESTKTPAKELAERHPASSRRIVPTIDLTSPKERLAAPELRDTLRLSVTHFYQGVVGLRDHLGGIAAELPETFLPPRLVGAILQPDGSPGRHLQVDVELPKQQRSRADGPTRHTVTSADGSFSLDIPAGTGLRAKETVGLAVHGADGSARFDLSAKRIGRTGVVRDLRLEERLAPLPTSIVASIESILGGASGTVDTAPEPPASQPLVRLGEDDGVCGQIFGADAAVDRFPYSILFRLVEPRASVLNRVYTYRIGDRSFKVAARSERWAGGGGDHGVDVGYVDRVAVDQPISVDGFRDQLAGLGDGRKVHGEETVPMAGTLGLGYVVKLAQRWTPLGLTLGNLVYSLPLAPGEQQRVAIFERREETAVAERELLDVAEQQRFAQQQDSSAQATFDQAFSEMARGGSEFFTRATSESSGFNFLVASGGGGTATNEGQSTSWMVGQRDVSSRAAEETHASLERQAAAQRQAQRTSVRLASASEAEDVTTKVITNHNHTRALTLQYWEVQRLFDVSTDVEGVLIVCFVPLEVVRFLPAGEPVTLDAESQTITRPVVLDRYSQLLKNVDVLQAALPRRYRYGLNLLTEFAADPRATVDADTATAEDVITLSLHGSFLPFEEISVAAVTRRGTRVGPVRLTGSIEPIRDNQGPEGEIDPKQAFTSEFDLFGYLRDRRANDGVKLTGSLALPPSLARTDVIGFEITRQWQGLDHTFLSPELQAIAAASGLSPLKPGISIDPIVLPPITSWTRHFPPRELERQLGGPRAWHFSAAIEESSSTTETYATNVIDKSASVVLPPGAYPVAALELAPVLRYSTLLQIEKTLQHVVRHTLHYSEAIWRSLTPIERAVMLEGFTIGVPFDGIEDATQEVPLLNCVSNQVLGYYGNSMVMPFIIPKTVAEENGVSSRELEEALTEFHRVDFAPPTSRIALPTRGVLGEAVLGHCPSAEKIDLTRFWQWADSPADEATAIADVTLPTTAPSVAAGLQAPNTLTGLAPLITNFNNQPPIPVETSLLQGLVAAGAAQKDFTGLTNADLLAGLIKTTQQTAESARADALKRATELQSQAMTEVGNFFGAKGGEAYAANYRNGAGGGAAAPASSSTAQQKPAPTTTPAKKPTTPSKPPASSGKPATGGATPGGTQPPGGAPSPGGTPGGAPAPGPTPTPGPSGPTPPDGPTPPP